MRQVVPPFWIVQKILGEQKKNKGAPCRLTVHCVRVERPEGVLLYHTLTGELLLLTKEEADKLSCLPGPVPAALGALVPRWFLRPEGTDDVALADQVRAIATRFRKKDDALTRYKIFTTTACNARCFYCFEAGWKNSTMSEQVARDTASYIVKHCGGKPVHLHWFGGEPLVNVRAIDIITDSLREHGVELHSTMTSNGYLFDRKLVKRAREVWGLDIVQITLDGTEEVYNARKDYVNPEGSPFQRVLRNIDLLLEADIGVNVRLNMDGENERDLYTLIDQLAVRFGGKSGFGIHLLEIQGNYEGVDPPDYVEEELLTYAEKLRSLRVYAEKKGIAARPPLSRGFSINACRADSDSATTVTPEGMLGKCNSCINGTIWGSIYSGEMDKELLRQWRERKPPEAACKTCAIYPQCLRLKKCPHFEHCFPIDRETRTDRLSRNILGAYEDWKASGQA